VRAHTPAVYAHALRFFGDPSAAEDVVQEVWIKVYRTLDSFDGDPAFRRGSTGDPQHVPGSGARGQARAGAHRLARAAPTAGDFADEVALSASLENAMSQLAPEDRDALSAVSVFDLSYAEAAATLGFPLARSSRASSGRADCSPSRSASPREVPSMDCLTASRSSPSNGPAAT